MSLSLLMLIWMFSFACMAHKFLIHKAGGKPLICIDYTNLNKVCPKDPFPFPQVDQIMDSTLGCDLLCFLDAYSDFHQITISKEDEEHTAFIIVDGLFAMSPCLMVLRMLFLPLFVSCIRHSGTSLET
jgi:hypothetical protein